MSAERRREMVKHSLPSIEQIAAYLDGNLPEHEMKQFSLLAEHDDMLHQLLDASSVVDDAMSNFSDSDLQLPPDLAGSSFEIPTIPTEGISELVTLTPEPSDYSPLVAAACADEDIIQFSHNDDDDKFGFSGQTDGQINLSLDNLNESLETNDDVSIIPDNS